MGIPINIRVHDSGRYLGVNLGWSAPFAPGGYMWADAFKSGRPFTIADDALAPLDANGWPTQASRMGFLQGFSWPAAYAVSGYQLRYKGTGGVTGNNVTITNLTAPDGNGYRTADVAVNGVDHTWLDFASAVQDASLIRPGHTLGVDYWDNDFLAAIEPFGLLRTMQTFGPSFQEWGFTQSGGVMFNDDTTWASRTRPGSVGYGYNGPALEEFILLANATGKDIWICIPHQTTDDYATKLAQLLLYGSDGSTGEPLTALTTHDPATWTPSTTDWYPGLAAGRNVYIEYSNEIWNYLPVYADAAYDAEILAGDPHHFEFDAEVSYDRWIAWKGLKISTLFRAVWGDSAMQDRVRIVLANQGDWAARTSYYMLPYITAVFGGDTYGSSIDGVPTGHPVSYYFHSISGSFYGHWNNPADADTAFTQLGQSLSTPGGLAGVESVSIQERIDAYQTMAAGAGIKFTSYESGLEIPNNAVSAACDADARMQTYTEAALSYHYGKANADASVYFWLAGPSSLDVGLGPDLLTTTSYRWQAIRNIASGAV